MSKGNLITIGDYKVTLHPDRAPEGWSMEEDAWRSVEQLDANTHRLVSWMGRVGYVIEFAGKATMLPSQSAMVVSRIIAHDEAARRHPN